MTKLKIALMSATLVIAAAQPSFAQSPQQAILDDFAAQAQNTEPGFAGFSAQRGQAMFTSHPATGKPDTPSCTTCHGKDAFTTGQTRAGKPIEPMALSRTPDRYSDPAKVAKWFLRNCTSVLGRECTALEKGDFITFMTSQ